MNSLEKIGSSAHGIEKEKVEFREGWSLRGLRGRAFAAALLAMFPVTQQAVTEGMPVSYDTLPVLSMFEGEQERPVYEQKAQELLGHFAERDASGVMKLRQELQECLQQDSGKSLYSGAVLAEIFYSADSSEQVALALGGSMPTAADNVVFEHSVDIATYGSGPGAQWSGFLEQSHMTPNTETEVTFGDLQEVSGKGATASEAIDQAVSSALERYRQTIGSNSTLDVIQEAGTTVSQFDEVIGGSVREVISYQVIEADYQEGPDPAYVVTVQLRVGS